MYTPKDYAGSEGSTSKSKTLNPGEQYGHIASVKLTTPSYNKDAYFLEFVIEGKAEPGFEGFQKDRVDPSKGHYNGPIVNVKNGAFPFSTFTFKGEEIKRDDQIARWITNMAKQLGKYDDICAEDLRAETIEEYVEAVAKHLTKDDCWGLFTIAGEEYMKEAADGKSYKNYRYCYFPKSENKKFPFVKADENSDIPGTFLRFDSSKHVKNKEEVKHAVSSETVEGFTSESPIKL